MIPKEEREHDVATAKRFMTPDVGALELRNIILKFDETIDEMEKEIERLKCCQTCDHFPSETCEDCKRNEWTGGNSERIYIVTKIPEKFEEWRDKEMRYALEFYGALYVPLGKAKRVANAAYLRGTIDEMKKNCKKQKKEEQMKDFRVRGQMRCDNQPAIKIKEKIIKVGENNVPDKWQTIDTVVSAESKNDIKLGTVNSDGEFFPNTPYRIVEVGQ